VGKFLFNPFLMNGREELLPALLSLTFLFATFVPIRIYDRKKKEDSRFQVYIKESLS
jgi:positive regulator of sigma E activity